jgi:colanic acid/amylovoran biosynthesis glycosyltransferase
MITIGYLVPEFPGQTHNFFWREIQALNELGVGVQLVSTRLPPLSLESTSWGKKAKERTAYLFPLNGRSVIRTMYVLMKAGRKRLWQCLRIILAVSNLPLRARLRLLGLAFIGAYLGHLTRANNIQHIHVHSCADAANIALFASIISSITYSLTLHNPVATFGPNQHAKWQHASFAIVIAKWVLVDLRDQLGNVLPEKISIAPMGVDLDKFCRNKPYAYYEKPQPLRLFSCARLNPAKGFMHLFAAVERLNSAGYKVILRIAGEDDNGGGGYRSEIEASIRDLRLVDFVTLLGSVSEEVVRDELQEAHIFVLASLEEPLGVALMEAMAMEVPVVATNAGGVPELIEDKVHGMLVPPGDAEALANAILSIAKDVKLASIIRGNGRARVEAEFGHRVSAVKIKEHLNKIT